MEPAETVGALMDRLRADFAGFASAFSEGNYALWLGSGISRERLPGVWDLIASVLDFLRVNADFDNPGCSHRIALEEILDHTALTPDERSGIDFTTPAKSWARWETIVRGLGDRYAEVLDVSVAGETDDYLVWTGLDVAGTYGDPNIDPDVEHYCVALLMLEGVVRVAVTANWDGLLEKALDQLCDEPDALVRVVVKKDEFRDLGARRPVIKFHGCAVRASKDEGQYRPMLIARASQIQRWAELADHQHMRKELERLFSVHPTLMMGLSTQDSNMHTMFHSASQDLVRCWDPTQPPALVLSEQNLHGHHKRALKATYGDDFSPNATAIEASALLGAWAKPTFVGLLLWVLTEKLVFLLDHVPALGAHAADVDRMKDDLRALRSKAAEHAGAGTLEFVTRVAESVSHVIGVFRRGASSAADGFYEALTSAPIAEAVLNRDFPAEKFGHLALALSLIGRGQAAGTWDTIPGSRTAPEGGVVRLRSANRDVKVFAVRDHEASIELERSGVYEPSDGNVLVVHAGDLPPDSTRSPRGRLGRTGNSEPAHLSMKKLGADATSADDMYSAFKQAGGF
jgi:hypothetical protein